MPPDPASEQRSIGIDVPLGDFHSQRAQPLTEHPAWPMALSEYRIKPGNVGKGDKRDRRTAR